MKIYFRILLPLAAILAVGAVLVTPGLKVSQYPYTNNPPGYVLLLLADTNSTPNTNWHTQWSDVLNQVTNLTTNIVNTAASNRVTVAAGTNIVVDTNLSGYRIIYTVSLDSAATNGFVTSSVTNGFATTNYVNSATNNLATTITNRVTVSTGSNATVVTNITGDAINYVVSGTGSGSLTGTTNFINLSVQAGKQPSTNAPGIDASAQDWELVYYKTNNEGSTASLNASWQFVMPPDYATNSLKVRLLSTLLATNGPNSSNTIFKVSIFKATPGSSTDVRNGAFSAQVAGTNTWAASTSNTNLVQTLVINLNTNSLVQTGDLVILKVARDAVNDTFGSATSLVGVQLEYTRP